MPLITKSHVKDRWPEWETYCSAHDDLTPDEALDLAITDATTAFQELLPEVNADNINDALRRHLRRMVKKEAFDFLHGDTEFATTPQIVQDYRDSLETIERYRTGELALPIKDEPGDNDEEVRMNSKPRRFGPDDWFTDQRTDRHDWP